MPAREDMLKIQKLLIANALCFAPALSLLAAHESRAMTNDSND
jgi:hypothetical protein